MTINWIFGKREFVPISEVKMAISNRNNDSNDKIGFIEIISIHIFSVILVTVTWKLTRKKHE